MMQCCDRKAGYGVRRNRGYEYWFNHPYQATEITSCSDDSQLDEG